MKVRWKIFIGVVILLTVFISVCVLSLHIQPATEVDAYKKFLRAKGEKLDLNEVALPPIAAESNSVDVVQNAFALFSSGDTKSPDAMKMVAPGKALVGWMQPEVHGYDFTNSWDDFALAIAPDRPALDLLHQVLNRPTLQFREEDEVKGMMPHLTQIKEASQKLTAETVYDLHAGDTAAAVTNTLTLLALVRENERQGLLISHLVRLSILSIGIAPTWELLQATNVTDAQLAAVQAQWENMNPLADAACVFVTERAWGIKEIEKWRNSHESLTGLFVGMGTSGSGGGSGWTWPPDIDAITEKPRYAVGEMMWRSSWSYSDELDMLKREQIILEALRAMQTNVSQNYETDFDAMDKRLASVGSTNFGVSISRILRIPYDEWFGGAGLKNAVAKTLRMVAASRVVVSAVALKRFQYRHGALPETLDQLVPDLLPSVPIDPYDGKPLRYHAIGDGTFFLYSVGPDGVDDGGMPADGKTSGTPNLYWQNDHARDWVWPQPATAAEIESYYQKTPE